MHKLGFDAGSLYLKAAVVNNSGIVTIQSMKAHRGNPASEASAFMNRYNLKGRYSVGVTGLYGKQIANHFTAALQDDVRAQIVAVKKYYPQARNIMVIGGSSAVLIELDGGGGLNNITSNTLCAAGTGSFLDQQAKRLEIEYDDIPDFAAVPDPPSIAARCAVFAKSDLIHRQQEGFSRGELWSGLCKGLAKTLANTLLRGRSLNGLTIVTGGVAQNREIMRWLSLEFGENMQTFELAPYTGAIGAALLSSGNVRSVNERVVFTEPESKIVSAPRSRPLLLLKSKWPSPGDERAYVDKYCNEVRVSETPVLPVAEAFIGIDIGSTSTKAVVVTREGDIAADFYRKTSGDPIRASQLILCAVKEYFSATVIRGCATTGSGRKLAGAVLGADLVVNEISAHVRGALKCDNSIETIFEIGGQDSKYMRLKNGVLCDAVMNYACAAGTGSFIEEQAGVLGFSLDEIGDNVLGVAPPETSDRCTVFMEQDVHSFIRQGYSRRDVMAAVLRSVACNYVTKVVGKKYVSKSKIFFQGATARNKGLVAALENMLDTEIVVSRHCHVLGAYGAALMAMESMNTKKRETRFRGMGLTDERILLNETQCPKCANSCRITSAFTAAGRRIASYGYRCGRDESDNARAVNNYGGLIRMREKMMTDHNTALQIRSMEVIGLPAALSNYLYLPFWKAFFSDLGYTVAVSPKSNDAIVENGCRSSGADFCFPVKVAYGHVEELLNDRSVHAVFLPYMIGSKKHPYASNSSFCPYIQSMPAHVKASTLMRDKIIDPVIDFSLGEKALVKNLHGSLSKKLNVSRCGVRDALREARSRYARIRNLRMEVGRKTIKALNERGEKGIVILGRLYNILDPRIGLGLPEKIAGLGVTVIPLDFMPFEPENFNSVFYNMYWAYGQWILNAAETVRREKNLFAVYITNYGCGPDSFIVRYVEELMGEKPMLVLELDEHGQDTGYMTRIEAFLDVIRAVPSPQKYMPVSLPRSNGGKMNNRTLWIPNLHPAGARLFAAAFRKHGYRAFTVPRENEEMLRLGRAVTAGSECLPMAVTLGSLLYCLKAANASGSEHALFMPTTDGPCRFGQYALMQKIILQRLGYDDFMILSPTSSDTYSRLLGSRLRRDLWRAVLIGELIFKMRCRVKPYEKENGITEKVFMKAVERMERSMEGGEKLEDAFMEVRKSFEGIERSRAGTKPLVGVVGEIFVRHNAFSNNDIVEHIESCGGEAWVSTVAEWVHYTSYVRGSGFIENHFLHRDERYWHKLAGELMDGREEPSMENIVAEGKKHLPVSFQGESIITLGRALLFKEQGAAMVANLSPFGCMHGVISSAIFERIRHQLNIPVANMFYDGKSNSDNRLRIFIESLKKSGYAGERVRG